MGYINIYSNIIAYQKYIGTSIKVGCATHSLYASSDSKAERDSINNQRGRGSGPCNNIFSSKQGMKGGFRDSFIIIQSKQIWQRHAIPCKQNHSLLNHEINQIKQHRKLFIAIRIFTPTRKNSNFTVSEMIRRKK